MARFCWWVDCESCSNASHFWAFPFIHFHSCRTHLLSLLSQALFLRFVQPQQNRTWLRNLNCLAIFKPNGRMPAVWMWPSGSGLKLLALPGSALWISSRASNETKKIKGVFFCKCHMLKWSKMLRGSWKTQHIFWKDVLLHATTLHCRIASGRPWCRLPEIPLPGSMEFKCRREKLGTLGRVPEVYPRYIPTYTTNIRVR